MDTFNAAAKPRRFLVASNFWVASNGEKAAPFSPFWIALKF
jgi:hypothetical protein